MYIYVCVCVSRVLRLLLLFPFTCRRHFSLLGSAPPCGATEALSLACAGRWRGVVAKQTRLTPPARRGMIDRTSSPSLMWCVRAWCLGTCVGGR